MGWDLVLSLDIEGYKNTSKERVEDFIDIVEKNKIANKLSDTQNDKEPVHTGNVVCTDMPDKIVTWSDIVQGKKRNSIAEK